MLVEGVFKLQQYQLRGLLVIA